MTFSPASTDPRLPLDLLMPTSSAISGSTFRSTAAAKLSRCTAMIVNLNSGSSASQTIGYTSKIAPKRTDAAQQARRSRD